MIEIFEMSEKDLSIIKNNYNEFDDFWKFETLENEFNNDNTKYYVAKEKDIVVGFVGILIGPFDIEIMNIAVKKERRRSGIGSILLEKIIKKTKELKKENLNLEVNEENKNAIKLYEKFGFKKDGIRKKYYNENDAIIMSLNFE